MIQTVFERDGKKIYVCNFPSFITHHYDYEPCDVLVGCKNIKDKTSNNLIFDYEKIKDFNEIECICDENSISKYTELGFPTCVRFFLGEAIDNPENFQKCIGFLSYSNGDCICPEDYISNKDELKLKKFGYKSSVAYSLTRLPKTCIKKPCMFDPITGDKIDGYWNGSFCICNVEKSVFPIFIDEDGNGNCVDVEQDKGFNACLKANTNDSPSENVVYVTQFIPPTGETQVWFKPWNFRPDAFPHYKPLNNFQDFINLPFQKKNPNSMLEGLIETTDELSENFLETVDNGFKNNEKLMIPFKPENYEELPKTFPFSKDDTIRNPISLTGEINFPMMAIEYKNLSILNYNSTKSKFSNLPKLKKN